MTGAERFAIAGFLHEYEEEGADCKVELPDPQEDDDTGTGSFSAGAGGGHPRDEPAPERRLGRTGVTMESTLVATYTAD